MQYLSESQPLDSPISAYGTWEMVFLKGQKYEIAEMTPPLSKHIKRLT